jgi:integrase
LKAILRAAKKQKFIQFVPDVEPTANKPKEKGILTIEEVDRLFSIEWKTEAVHCHPARENFMGYAGNVLAAATGLRMGELQALTLADVHLDVSYLYIWRSWDKMYGLNETTKTGRARNIFISDTVKSVLLQLIRLNPDPGNLESFLFFSEKTPGKPAEPAIFTRSLYMAMRLIGITEEQRRARNITFHSWRHFLNSLLINANVPLPKIQSMTGHGTIKMSQHYYHLDDMADVRAIQESIFTPSPAKDPAGENKIN